VELARENVPVAPNRYSMLRDIAALLLVAVACPVAVFGGANLGCVGSSAFSGSCAVTVIFVSPVILLVAGAIAGILSRGWTGLMVSLIGMVMGMFAILGLSFVAGKPVPVDLFSGIFATVFFGFPIVVGYAIGRVISKLFATRTT
jgi:hypothetical protein